jgi:hypothetical protein
MSTLSLSWCVSSTPVCIWSSLLAKVFLGGQMNLLLFAKLVCAVALGTETMLLTWLASIFMFLVQVVM